MYLRTTLSILAVCGTLILAAATVTDCDASFKRPAPGGTCESTCAQCPGIATSTPCELAGCTWDPGACTGTACPETCGDLNETDCESATGCTWGTFECTGDCTPCEDHDPSVCEDYSGCGTVDGTCSGDATDCINLSGPSCELANCGWGNCYGGPQDCSCITDQNFCVNGMGCAWTGSCVEGASTDFNCNHIGNNEQQCDYASACCTWDTSVCTGNPQACTEYSGKTDCEAVGCTWTPETCDGTCTQCEEHTDTTVCVLNGCNVNSTQGCQATCTPCSTFTTDTTCGQAPTESGCNWQIGSCQAPASCAEGCADNANETDCAGQSGCTWIAN